MKDFLMTQSALLRRTRDVCDSLRISRTTLHRLRERGDFPTPIRLGPNSVGFLASDVQAWLESRRMSPPTPN
jgi:prophage regulatory protein